MYVSISVFFKQNRVFQDILQEAGYRPTDEDLEDVTFLYEDADDKDPVSNIFCFLREWRIRD